MGSRGGVAAPSEDAFRRQWRDPKVRKELRALGVEVPEQLGTLFMADSEGLRGRTSGVPPLTDGFPLRLSREIPDRDTIAHYREWADSDRARQAFLESAWVEKVFPPGLREATLPYFAHQGWINRLMPNLADGPAEVEPRMTELHELLADTPLETLPLWLLGSDADEARIVNGLVRRGQGDASLKLPLAFDLLSRRRYAQAAAAFRATSADGMPSYEALALALGGHMDEARAAIARVPASTDAHPPEAQEIAYWRWFSEAFGLPNPHGSPP